MCSLQAGYRDRWRFSWTIISLQRPWAEAFWDLHTVGPVASWHKCLLATASMCVCFLLYVFATLPQFLEFHYMWTSTHMIGLTSCAIGKETSQCRVCTGARICNIHPSLTLSPIWTHTGHTVQVCGFLDPPYMCYAPRSVPEWAYGCVHLAGLGVYFTWTVSCHVKTFL